MTQARLSAIRTPIDDQVLAANLLAVIRAIGTIDVTMAATATPTAITRTTLVAVTGHARGIVTATGTVITIARGTVTGIATDGIRVVAVVVAAGHRPTDNHQLLHERQFPSRPP